MSGNYFSGWNEKLLIARAGLNVENGLAETWEKIDLLKDVLVLRCESVNKNCSYCVQVM